jgi:hypothetical protein
MFNPALENWWRIVSLSKKIAVRADITAIEYMAICVDFLRMRFLRFEINFIFHNMKYLREVQDFS